MGYWVMGETRRGKERKEIRIVMWGFVVKGRREKGKERKREKKRRHTVTGVGEPNKR